MSSSSLLVISCFRSRPGPPLGHITTSSPVSGTLSIHLHLRSSARQTCVQGMPNIQVRLHLLTHACSSFNAKHGIQLASGYFEMLRFRPHSCRRWQSRPTTTPIHYLNERQATNKDQSMTITSSSGLQWSSSNQAWKVKSFTLHRLRIWLIYHIAFLHRSRQHMSLRT